MRKFFMILGVLFLISLTVTIFAGNLSWETIKTASATVKESFIKVSKSVGETSVKVKDFVAEKIQEIKDKRKK